MSEPETFTIDQTIMALESFLAYAASEEGKSQQGYFSGRGWAARCVRAHIKALIPSSDFYKRLGERENQTP